MRKAVLALVLAALMFVAGCSASGSVGVDDAHRSATQPAQSDK